MEAKARHGKRYGFAWRRAFESVVWWTAPLSLLGMVVIGLLANAHDPIAQMIGLSAVAGIGALAGGVSAAFVFAPGDEPSLELVLSAPRPLAYLIVERLVTIYALHGAAALIGALMLPVVAPGMSTFADQFMRWFAPFTLAVGIGLAICLITRRSSFGVLLVILLCGSMLFGGVSILLQIADWAWIVHLFLPPERFTAEQVFINRAFLLGSGMLLIGYTFILVREPEKLLMTRE